MVSQYIPLTRREGGEDQILRKEVLFVSVIIPTRNRHRLLKDTIESLLNQSYRKDRYEIIVIDNNSKDGTEEMVEAYKRDNLGMLSYYKKEDEGPGIARNFAISKAKGRIVAFTEDDCVADPHWLERGVEKMATGVGLVQGKTLPKPGKTSGTFSRTQQILGENRLYQTFNILYRKEILHDVGGFSSAFIGKDFFKRPMMAGEDTDLGWKVKKLGWGTVFADDAIVYHHVFNIKPWDLIFNYRKLQLYFYAWPNLVKRHPQMRKQFFYSQLFRFKENAIFAGFLLSLFLGILIQGIFSLLSFPYVVNLLAWCFYGRPLRTYHRGLVTLIIYILNDIVNFILLLAGSIWYRSLVL